MLIGIFGDCHDNLPAIRQAVELFNDKKVELVIFTGDLVSPFAATPLEGLDADLVGVFGNNEGDIPNLSRKLETLGTQFNHFLEMEYMDRKIAVYHGQTPSILDSIIKSNKYDVVATGHTHSPEVTFEENTLVINPGETCGYLSGVKTLALLDIEKMAADIQTLE